MAEERLERRCSEFQCTERETACHPLLAPANLAGLHGQTILYALLLANPIQTLRPVQEASRPKQSNMLSES